MKKALPVTAVLATVALATFAARAQEAPSVMSASPAFAQLQPDMQGTVTQPLMHAPAGDVIAVYFGRAPKQVYSKQDELIYVISGHGSVTVGYPSYDIGPGSLISIPRNTAFDVLARGNAPVKAILIASPSDNPSDKKILEQTQQ